MSGYLTRLLRRSFDPSVAMVEPRLNTLFSPPEKISSGPAPKVEDQPAESVQADTSPDNFETAASRDPVVLDRSTQTPLAAREPAPLHSPPRAALAFHPSTKTTQMEKNNDAANSHGGPAPSHGVSEMPEPADPVQTPAAQGNRERKSSPRVTRTQHEKRIAPPSSPPVSPEARIAAVHQADDGLEPEALTSLNDEGGPVSSSPLSVKSGARSYTPPEGAHARETARPPRVSPNDKLLRGKREEDPTTTETRKVVPATPVRGWEASKTARGDNPVLEHAASPESRSTEFNFDRPLFFPFPVQLRERGGRKASPSVEPTIEVTIGRIEVKGAASPQPQRSSSQLLKGPNLEEYLRRRSGRSRE
jgi:hypothetical protein